MEISNQVIQCNYWEGPYGVRVHNSITDVVADDGYNTMYKDGGQTERWKINAEPMNETIYRSTYAELGLDGHYYYKSKDQERIIKIALDVDLIDKKTEFVRSIVRTQQMTQSNYKNLISSDAITFEEA